MKRPLVTVLVLCAALQSYSEVSVGLNLTSRSTSTTEKFRITETTSTETGTGTYELGVRPSVIINVGENIEIVPFAGFSYNNWKATQDGDVQQENGSSGFDLGCGLFFRIIDGEILRFSIGPQFSYGMMFPHESEQVTTLLGLGAPANIDICFSDRFFMRASPVLVQFSFGHTRVDEDRSRSVTSFDIVTENGLSIGFFFTF